MAVVLGRLVSWFICWVPRCVWGVWEIKALRGQFYEKVYVLYVKCFDILCWYCTCRCCDETFALFGGSCTIGFRHFSKTWIFTLINICISRNLFFPQRKAQHLVFFMVKHIKLYIIRHYTSYLLKFILEPDTIGSSGWVFIGIIGSIE